MIEYLHHQPIIRAKSRGRQISDIALTQSQGTLNLVGTILSHKQSILDILPSVLTDKTEDLIYFKLLIII